MKNKFTHQGYIVGCDARTRPDFRRLVKLRETKCFWASETGSKFNKARFMGHGIGDYPLYRLQTETITELTETK